MIQRHQQQFKKLLSDLRLAMIEGDSHAETLQKLCEHAFGNEYSDSDDAWRYYDMWGNNANSHLETTGFLMSRAIAKDPPDNEKALEYLRGMAEWRNAVTANARVNKPKETTVEALRDSLLYIRDFIDQRQNGIEPKWREAMHSHLEGYDKAIAALVAVSREAERLHGVCRGDGMGASAQSV